MNTEYCFCPDIPLPDSIGIAVTQRLGGQSKAPYDSFNIAEHVGDAPVDVAANRQRLLDGLDGASAIQWLNQTHSCTLVEAGKELRPNADACYSTERALACAVMTADCLPILLWRGDGSAVAAVHAGWRGLAAGILAQSFASLKQLGGKKTDSWNAFIGPAISQAHFEVGVEVLETFFEQAASAALLEATADASKPSKNNPLKYHLDLSAIAKAQLLELGVAEVYGGQDCSFANCEAYYSYRRASAAGDSRCGRMASLIWRK